MKMPETLQRRWNSLLPREKTLAQVTAAVIGVALLRQSAGGVSGRDLETILASLSAAAPAGKAATAIEFAAGEARIKGLALSAEEAAGLATRLKTQGYAARTEGDTLLVRLEPTP